MRATELDGAGRGEILTVRMGEAWEDLSAYSRGISLLSSSLNVFLVYNIICR